MASMYGVCLYVPRSTPYYPMHSCMVNSRTGDDWTKAKTQTEVGVFFFFFRMDPLMSMYLCSVLTTCLRSESRWSLQVFQQRWITDNVLATELKASNNKFAVLLMGICCASTWNTHCKVGNTDDWARECGQRYPVIQSCTENKQKNWPKNLAQNFH